jgi:hypothetical protein
MHLSSQHERRLIQTKPFPSFPQYRIPRLPHLDAQRLTSHPLRTMTALTPIRTVARPFDTRKYPLYPASRSYRHHLRLMPATPPILSMMFATNTWDNDSSS